MLEVGRCHRVQKVSSSASGDVEMSRGHWAATSSVCHGGFMCWLTKHENIVINERANTIWLIH